MPPVADVVGYLSPQVNGGFQQIQAGLALCFFVSLLPVALGLLAFPERDNVLGEGGPAHAGSSRDCRHVNRYFRHAYMVARCGSSHITIERASPAA
jgi:hypothetical protein